MEKRRLEVDRKKNPTLALRSDDLLLRINEDIDDIENALNELWKEGKIQRDNREYYYATT